MLLANIKVPKAQISGVKDIKEQHKGTSLKNLNSVRQQIRKQENVRKDLQKAAKEGKKSKVSAQIQQEIQKAFDKLRGVKVHDDLGLLRRAEKRILRKKKKSAENWNKRKEDVKQSQADRQQKRKDNIDKYRSKKVTAKMAKKGDDSDPNNLKMTRKVRRHENLMKFGPKKDREEREQKKKDFRKQIRKDKRSSLRS